MSIKSLAPLFFAELKHMLQTQPTSRVALQKKLQKSRFSGYVCGNFAKFRR